MSAKIEAQLHDSLVAAAKDAIISIDEQHNIVLFNPAAEVVFRCTASEVVGKPLDRFVPAAVRDAHIDAIVNFTTHARGDHDGARAGATRHRLADTTLPDAHVDVKSDARFDFNADDFLDLAKQLARSGR